jgi:hypothetical protein
VYLGHHDTAPNHSQHDWRTWIDDALTEGKMQL